MKFAKDSRAARRFADAKMQKVNLFESERAFTDVYGLEPGQEQAAHVHQGADKVYFVIEGTGRFSIDTEEFDAGPGFVVYAPSGLSHGVRNETSERLTLLAFMAPHPNFKP